MGGPRAGTSRGTRRKWPRAGGAPRGQSDPCRCLPWVGGRGLFIGVYSHPRAPSPSQTPLFHPASPGFLSRRMPFLTSRWCKWSVARKIVAGVQLGWSVSCGAWAGWVPALSQPNTRNRTRRLGSFPLAPPAHLRPGVDIERLKSILPADALCDLHSA